MKNKILKYLIFLFFMMIIIETRVQAWSTPNKTSFALGCKYSDGLDTSVDAKNANKAYSSMGLNYTKLLTNANMSDVLWYHDNRYSYLNSGIVFLSGHGNSGLMSFMNNGQNKFYIMSNSTTSGQYIGIGQFITSSNALVVFGGCETAKGDNNISSYAVKMGAKISIGWTEEVNSGSHTNWLKRFNNKIKDKKTTVNQAKASADGYIYLDSRVKTGKVYGYGNYNPWYFMNGGSYSNNYELSSIKERKEDDRAILISNNGTENNVIKFASRYIKNYIDQNFDIKDFKIEKNGNDNIYYDLILYVGRIRTSIGYTISLLQNGKIILYNNMNNKTILEAKKTIKDLKIDNEKLIRKQRNINNNDDSKKIYLSTAYYDFDNNELSYINIYDIINRDGTLGSELYSEKI